MSDYKRDLLETIHSEQEFGKSVYINPEDLTIILSYEKPEDERFVFLGIPVTDEDYDKWFFNQEDNEMNLTDCYLTGETEVLYDKLYKDCENTFEKYQEKLEENGFSSVEDMVNKSYDLDTVIPEEDAERINDLHNEVKSYIISDQLSESIKSFDYYTGAWQNISDYERFLSDDSDRLDFRELSKAYSIFAFKNAKDTNDFKCDFDDNDLDTEAILDYYAESMDDLSKDRLLMLSNIQVYFSSYPTDYGYLKKYSELATDEERMALINDNEYMSPVDLIQAGFYPKNEPEALGMVEQKPFVLDSISDDFGDNIKVVLAAVKNAGRSLGSASEELRNNPMVVLEAVLNDKHALEYASEEIKSLCKGDDPAKLLENLILKDKLSKDLNNDLGVKSKKMKL